jgi:DMSO/TMAO reductase YedYZ molybdopterin-dependent catalytic subunit
MKAIQRYLFSISLVLILLVGCQPKVVSTPTLAVSADDANFTLTIQGAETQKELDMAAIKNLPAVEGQAGFKSSTGAITIPALYKGVLLTDLLKQVGGDDPSLAVEVEAEDGYSMTFTYDQIANGAFIMYDPATGEETTKAGPVQVILAYESDGKPLNQETDGHMRLMVISKEANQVVDGHWTTKFVKKLTVKPIIEEWVLEMQGAIQYTVDRGSFESCSTTKCHQASWQDTDAQIYVGVPLYMLVGEVDDENKHDKGGYNAALAQAGYTIDLIAKDGYTVTFDSKEIDGNQNIIVAYTVNDNPLSDKDFPLKLVGPDLTKKQMIGGIAKIVLHLNPSTVPTETALPEVIETAEIEVTETESAEAATGVAFEILGKVDAPQSFTLADLKALNVVEVTVDGPKGKKVNAEGVRLSDLIALAKIKKDAKAIVFKAVDGYTAEVSLSSLSTCTDCMVAFSTGDSLKSVMPGMDSFNWVKDLISMEVK